MYASYIGHENILNFLLKADADVNITNLKGQTALMLAASCGNDRVAHCLCQVSNCHFIKTCSTCRIFKLLK